MSGSNSGQKGVVIQLDEYDRSLGTDELNLAEFPLASLSSRNDTGSSTLLFEDTIFDEGAKKNVERTVVIAGSDHFGLPTSTDSDILLLLVHLTNVRNGMKAKRVEFSRYELIKFLGWPQDGRSYKRLDESLQRWTSVTLHYKHAWWDRSTQIWKTRAFHVIETLELRGRGEIHDDGLSSFVWNDVIFESFNAGNLKRIDLGVYFSLRLATSRQVYRFLDKRMYLRTALEFDLRQFGTEHIGLSRKYDNYELKRKLIPALRELEEIGFLAPCPAEDRFHKLASGEWIISVQKGQGTKARQLSESPIVKELTDRRVNRKIALELAAEFSAEQIEEKIKLHDEYIRAKDKRISRNPAGFLTAAIRHNYEAPPPVKVRKSVSAVSAERRGLDSRIQVARDDGQTLQENADAEFKKHYNSLSVEDRARLERDALQNAPKFFRDTLKRLESTDHNAVPEMRQHLVRDYWQKQRSKTN